MLPRNVAGKLPNAELRQLVRQHARETSGGTSTINTE